MEAKVVVDCETTVAGGRAVTCYTPNANGIHEQKKNSGVCDPISLASSDGAVSGDDSDLVHYRTEFTILSLNVLGASGRLSGHGPII